MGREETGGGEGGGEGWVGGGGRERERERSFIDNQEVIEGRRRVAPPLGAHVARLWRVGKDTGAQTAIGPSQRESERKRSLLTIKKWLKVGQHNALSGHTASGRSGSSI